MDSLFKILCKLNPWFRISTFIKTKNWTSLLIILTISTSQTVAKIKKNLNYGFQTDNILKWKFYQFPILNKENVLTLASKQTIYQK